MFTLTEESWSCTTGFDPTTKSEVIHFLRQDRSSHYYITLISSENNYLRKKTHQREV